MGLSQENSDLVDYLTSEDCRDVLERDNISIHVESGDIFINNQNTGESIYDFLLNQQDENKKKLLIDFSYDDDYTNYITKYLPGINKIDDGKFDVLTNKNSKYLFYLFNSYRESLNKPKQFVRHSVVTDDNYALKELQNRNWPYFINKIIQFSQGSGDIGDIGVSDRQEANIIYNTRENFKIVRELYNELFNPVGVSLHELFKFMGIGERNRIDTDLTAHNFLTRDPTEVYIQGRILETFFYETGRFPGNSTIVSVPRARIPSFIESRDVLSPLALYDTFAGRDMRGIVSVQFLAALNIFLGGDSQQSRDAMSELFHNLSWQALTNDNDRHQIQFGHISMLVESINQII